MKNTNQTLTAQKVMSCFFSKEDILTLINPKKEPLCDGCILAGICFKIRTFDTGEEYMVAYRVEWDSEQNIKSDLANPIRGKSREMVKELPDIYKDTVQFDLVFFNIEILNKLCNYDFTQKDVKSKGIVLDRTICVEKDNNKFQNLHAFTDPKIYIKNKNDIVLNPDINPTQTEITEAQEYGIECPPIWKPIVVTEEPIDAPVYNIDGKIVSSVGKSLTIGEIYDAFKKQFDNN